MGQPVQRRASRWLAGRTRNAAALGHAQRAQWPRVGLRLPAAVPHHLLVLLLQVLLLQLLLCLFVCTARHREQVRSVCHRMRVHSPGQGKRCGRHTTAFSGWQPGHNPLQSGFLARSQVTQRLVAPASSQLPDGWAAVPTGPLLIIPGARTYEILNAIVLRIRSSCCTPSGRHAGLCCARRIARRLHSGIRGASSGCTTLGAALSRPALLGRRWRRMAAVATLGVRARSLVCWWRRRLRLAVCRRLQADVGAAV